ncbi:MAG: tetratricopeptide repeat protein [Tatlockia sp.]|jgi:Ca-activated chloride channel family protein
MKGFWLLALLCFINQSHSFDVSHLFSTNDQQAQVLMQKKQFKEAEQRFQHPEWKATAAYRAGDYAKALAQYNAFKNEFGFYNAGNAMAKLGQYKEAIKAYDKALALNPGNKDAQFNRKLLSDLLKKQTKQQKKEKNNEGKQDKDNPNQSASGGQNEAGKDSQNNATNQDGQKNQNPQDNATNPKQDASKNEQKAQKPEQNLKENASEKGKAEEAQSLEAREKQQAKNQWLRLVPDDPGGLLREKFLRDHLRREGEWIQ